MPAADPTVAIDVMRLGPGDSTWRWLHTVFSEPSCFVALPEENRKAHWVRALYERIAHNEIVALLPAVDGAAAGLLWAVPAESGIVFGHQFIMPRFRGWTGFRIVRACVVKLYEIMPDVNYILGFTPESNLASLVAARKAGFSEVGILPDFYDGEDAKIVAHRRNENG